MGYRKDIKVISEIKEDIEKTFGDRFTVYYDGIYWGEDDPIEYSYSYIKVAIFDKKFSDKQRLDTLYFEPTDFHVDNYVEKKIKGYINRIVILKGGKIPVKYRGWWAAGKSLRFFQKIFRNPLTFREKSVYLFT